jgi:hypothetical protein
MLAGRRMAAFPRFSTAFIGLLQNRPADRGSGFGLRQKFLDLVQTALLRLHSGGLPSGFKCLAQLLLERCATASRHLRTERGPQGFQHTARYVIQRQFPLRRHQKPETRPADPGVCRRLCPLGNRLHSPSKCKSTFAYSCVTSRISNLNVTFSKVHGAYGNPLNGPLIPAEVGDPLENWCGWEDLNLHGLPPQPPQGCVYLPISQHPRSSYYLNQLAQDASHDGPTSGLEATSSAEVLCFLYRHSPRWTGLEAARRHDKVQNRVR